ncbi:MAG: hypothetical protein QOD75_1788 [Blastocatellia bacterium]|jgi:hypothetical protein|nr:hypothetical protein [Blastocatellia bacterium]MEA2951603.1 hypothetical protein [Alphaproteobacteria bacterium]
MSADLLALPWQIQLSLASGYAAYALAYSGIRAHHKTIDVAFATLVFGLVATVVLNVLVWSGRLDTISASAIAFFSTIIVGLAWRKYLRFFVRNLLRILRVSHADDIPSAWVSLSEKPEFDVSQVSVKLKDGTWLRCDNTSQFAKAPFGPCVLGGNGDVILYLTHEKPPNTDAKSLNTVIDDVWGDRLTYVPASQISMINIRHKPH